MKFLLGLFILSGSYCSPLFAGDSASLFIPVESARFLTTDNLGNAYLIREDNSLIRYNEQGDSTGFYSSVKLGKLSWVDVTNPLMILLLYPQLSSIVLLDNMLSPKSTLDLKPLGLHQITAAGLSADGGIWIYDENNGKLLKINEQLERVTESNDLRQEIGFLPEVHSLVEYERKVYLCDPVNGLFIFDRNGVFLNKIELYGISRLQAVGNQFVWLQNNTLLRYDRQSFKTKRLELPYPDAVDARVGRDGLYILTPEGLFIQGR